MSRIIAGSHRGRPIAVPDSGRTRPTTDRVREALFSALISWAGTASEPPEQTLRGLAFCDLFCGSGAVGLEAASRGAGPVLLVEADRRAGQTASGNVASLGLAARVQVSRVEQLVRRAADTAYDIVFADPPYDLEESAVESVLSSVVEQGWVAPDGLLVVERSRRSPEVGWPAAVDDAWSRRYGETVLLFGHVDGVALPSAAKRS